MFLADVAGSLVPFEYWRGGDQVASGRPAVLVAVPPGGVAFVTVNKYRCDHTELQRPVKLGLTPPGADGPLWLSLGSGPDLSYCGPGDPGSRVAVSPMAATFTATLAVSSR